MTDSITPVGNSIDTTGKGLSSLSDILGIQQKRIALQQQAQTLETGKSLQQSAQATAQTDTRTAGEQQRLSQVPWTAFQNDDGSYDINKATKAALQVGGASGPEFVQRLGKMATESTASRAAANALNQQELSSSGLR